MTPDEIFLEQPTGRPLSHAIYFITGNPGLIGYYTTFLHDVHEKANEQNSEAGVALYGKSLGGFEVNTSSTTNRLYSADEQIDYVQAGIDAFAARLSEGSSEPLRLTLIGHSLGTYILMRILQRYYARPKSEAKQYRIMAGILLFPTIVDIAQSDNGVRMSWPLAIPFAHQVGGRSARTWARLMPQGILRNLLARDSTFASVGPSSEKDLTMDTLIAFLKSDLGVTECIYLAKHEMEKISADDFGDAVWGSSHGDGFEDANGYPRAKLFFYFGSDDHWVSEKTRETLIASYAFDGSDSLATRQDWQEDSRPWMEIDQHGTGHDFVVGGSQVVVEKVCEYLRVIL